MPFLIEHITEVVLALVVIVVLGTVTLVATTIGRRRRRERHFHRLDDMRQRYGPLVAGLLAGKLDYETGLETLRGITGLDRQFVLEQLCLEKRPTAAQVPALRRLCEDLGLVQTWQRRLAGQFDVATLRQALSRPEGILQRVSRLRFLVRAKSAENLGIIRHQPSWPLLVKALEDPHPDVQEVAVRSLSAIGEPQSFAPLLDRLHEVVLNPSTHLSLRAVKSALVSFPLTQAVGLLPSLKHSNRRIRFLATDIVREMVERESACTEIFALEPGNFPSELAGLFLARLCSDENPDVRARAAPVIACLRDPRATPVLLTLLEDEQWFVRLHTVRAMAKVKYLAQAAQIARHLIDPHWMVREATARTLRALGRAGMDQLMDYFLNRGDRYSQEQIAEEMQRAGLIPALLTQFAQAADGREARVIERLLKMGKTSYLMAVMLDGAGHDVRRKFLTNFGQHPDPGIQAWVEHLATREAPAKLGAAA